MWIWLNDTNYRTYFMAEVWMWFNDFIYPYFLVKLFANVYCWWYHVSMNLWIVDFFFSFIWNFWALNWKVSLFLINNLRLWCSFWHSFSFSCCLLFPALGVQTSSAFPSHSWVPLARGSHSICNIWRSCRGSNKANVLLLSESYLTP